MSKKSKALQAQLTVREILWSDWKRWLGMPLTMVKYSIDETRLYVRSGFFKTVEDELLLYRIMDIRSSRSLWQRIFGVGTVTLFCTDQSAHTLELKNIRNSETVRKYISQLVEQRREALGIAGREITGTGAIGMSHSDCDPVEMGEGMPAPPPPMPHEHDN